MLKQYHANVPGVGETNVKAHSVADAQWRLRSAMKMKRLPDGTRVDREDPTTKAELKMSPIKVVLRFDEQNYAIDIGLLGAFSEAIELAGFHFVRLYADAKSTGFDIEAPYNAKNDFVTWKKLTYNKIKSIWNRYAEEIV